MSDSDPSEVEIKEANPSVTIVNKVYLGDDEGIRCETSQAKEKVEGYYGDETVYCFTVTNTGDTHLNKVVIINPDLSVYDDYSIDVLEPGESVTIPLAGGIEENLINTVTVSAKASSPEGLLIDDIEEVTSTDTSEVAKLEYNTSITIENTGTFTASVGDNTLIRAQCISEMMPAIVVSRTFQVRR